MIDEVVNKCRHIVFKNGVFFSAMTFLEFHLHGIMVDKTKENRLYKRFHFKGKFLK